MTVDIDISSISLRIQIIANRITRIWTCNALVAGGRLAFLPLLACVLAFSRAGCAGSPGNQPFRPKL